MRMIKAKAILILKQQYPKLNKGQQALLLKYLKKHLRLSAEVWSESEKLLSNLDPNKPYSYVNKTVSTALLDKDHVDYSMEALSFIENAVMMIPISDKMQVHIHVYNMQGHRYLDIRQYTRNIRVRKRFRETSMGVRIPMEFLDQLVIRLKALQGKPNEWELKL